MDIDGAFCICCRKSLNRIGGSRRRSYHLSDDFVQSHPEVITYFADIANITEFGEEDKICRPCLLRAQRLVHQNTQAASIPVEEVNIQNAAVNTHAASIPVEEMPIQDAVENTQAASIPVEVPIQDSAENTHAASIPMEVSIQDAVENTQAASIPMEVSIQDAVENTQAASIPVEEVPIHDAENPEVFPVVNANVQDQAVQVNMSQQIPLPGYSRAPYNTHVCIIAGCFSRNLKRIHTDIRAVVLQEKCFYIPRGCRVCAEHSLDLVWQEIETNTRRILHEFSPVHIKDMMDVLRTRKVFLDFDRLTSINDTVFHYYIGFSKNQFQQILQSTPSIRQRFENKAGRALATVLTKLHTGDSNERLAKVFNMARRTLEKTMRLVRDGLISEFVPRHLGYDHITREEVISRSLSIPNYLFGNPEAPLTERRAIIILDGTYVYLQKSSNYHFQRKSYSLHKFRHLLKPFLIVCPDGHIINIYGLYEATRSDATIMSDILKSHNDPFHWFFNQDDVLILDRGFRDSIEDVHSYGYQGYMPASKNETEHQLTVQQANESRKVTMCRWVVETVNGRLKNQFRILRAQNFNIAARHLYDNIKIAGALLNAFGAPLVDHRLVNEIIRQIPLRDGNRNRLSEYVASRNLNRRRADFVPIHAEVPGMDEFPVLTADELIIYALGTYQIAQARSYYGEHVKNGTYIIEVYKEPNVEDFRSENLDCMEPWLLRGRIQSRHSSRRIYYVYILLERHLQGLNAIIEHYCTCIVGKRTLGCCSHVMSIIWFLGWGRYQENLTPPAQFLDTIIRHDIENEAYDEPENDV